MTTLSIAAGMWSLHINQLAILCGVACAPAVAFPSC
jgi:hypothetical protein